MEEVKAITWEEVIELADKALAELAEMMNRDAAHGIVYQQRMAVMMERKQRAMIEAARQKNERHSTTI